MTQNRKVVKNKTRTQAERRLTTRYHCLLIIGQRVEYLNMAGKPRKKPEETFYRESGSAIRLARVAAGKSQADVAEHLDLTFQQVQKYEKGVNRIPLWELKRLAVYLEVPISDLIDSSSVDAAFRSLAENFRAKEFQTLLESWGAIKDQPMRAAVLNIIRCAAALSRR